MRALVRPTRVPRSLPAGVETVYGDLASGAGLDEALRGADTVIHLAGVTKALRTEDYYTGNVRATEQPGARHGRARASASCMSVRWPRSAQPDGTPAGEDAEPHPLTHYGKSKLEAERVVRELAPDAVIVRPPVVYGPRDTDVFQIAEVDLPRPGAGDRRRRALVQRDLRQGPGGGCSPPPARPRGRAGPISWRTPSRSPGANSARRPRIMAARRAYLRVPFAGGLRGRSLRRNLGAADPQARHHLAREDRRSALHGLDLRYRAAPPRELGFAAPTSLDAGLAETLAWYKEAGWLTY